MFIMASVKKKKGKNSLLLKFIKLPFWSLKIEIDTFKGNLDSGRDIVLQIPEKW